MAGSIDIGGSSKSVLKLLEALKRAATGSYAALPTTSPTAAILIAIQHSNRIQSVHLVVGAFLVSQSILKAFGCFLAVRNDFAPQEQRGICSAPKERRRRISFACLCW